MSEGQSAGAVTVAVGTVITPGFEAGLDRAEQRVNEFGRRTGDATRQVTQLGETGEAATGRLHAGFTRAHFAGLHLSAGLGVLGAGLLVASQASAAASQALEVTGYKAGTTEGRFRNLGAALLHGDIIGGFQALGREMTFSDQAMERLVTSSAQAGSQVQIDGLKAIAASAGFKELAKQLVEVSRAATAAAAATALANEQATVGATAARTGLAGAAADAATFGERGDSRFGRGPGAIAESNARATGGTVTGPATVLPQRIQTAIALAQASGNVSNEVAQLRRGADFLTKALKQAGLTDAGKEQLASSLASVNSQIETLLKVPKKPKGPEAPIVPLELSSALASAELTKQTSDNLVALRSIDDYLSNRIKIEKDANRKLQELQELGNVRSQIATLSKSADPASTLGGLFAGPFLGSAEFQRAQSFGYKPRGQDLLRDLRQQVANFKEFEQALTTLRKHGASAGLVEELQQQGVGSLDQVRALAGAPKSLLRQYQAAYGQREKLATTQNIVIYVNSKSEADGVRKGLRQANFAAAAHAR